MELNPTQVDLEATLREPDRSVPAIPRSPDARTGTGFPPLSQEA